MVELPEKRETARWIQTQWEKISQRRAAKLVGIPRSTLRAPEPRRGRERQEQVKETALEHPRYGHRRITQKLREKTGQAVSRRNVQRIMQKLRLQVRTRRRRKWVARPAVERQVFAAPDQMWAMDFVEDWCVGVKRKVRVLTIVDCCTREAMALRAGYSMTGAKVVAELERLKLAGRKPKAIRLDNGPEFISAKLVNWCRINEVLLSYIERGKPQQNGYCESFNGRLRDECLNGHYFHDERDTQYKLDAWRDEYLHWRPHSGLGGRTPAAMAQELGVKTPFAFLRVDKAKAPQRQGDPNGLAALGLDAGAPWLSEPMTKAKGLAKDRIGM